jgi:hypothetical protein
MSADLKTSRARALACLADPAAPRVMNPTGLREWLAGQGVELGHPAMIGALAQWQTLGFVEKVRHGIYLNLRAQPCPQPDEAAPWLREGAVVSLQRVLGQSGVLNNPTPWITCVLPPSQSRAVGTIETGRHTFHFTGMRDDLIPSPGADWAADAYQPYAHVATATPEKALLDWIYLSKASPLWRLPPRQDIEVDDLDTDRLGRLAQRMGLDADLHQFIQGAAPAPAPPHPRRRLR